MADRENEITVGSGNVFADFGLPDADEHLLKAEIVVQLRRLIEDRQLNQSEAAKLVDIAQPDLSNVLRGRFRGYSVERLMRLLTAFDQDVEICVRPRTDETRQARIHVSGA